MTPISTFFASIISRLKTIFGAMSSFCKEYFSEVYAVLVIIIVVLIAHYFLAWWDSTIITGFFALTAALITPILAIHKYQKEQRTLRLQKLYFEDALLGQVKSIEAIMSQTNKNRYLTESLLNLIPNMLRQENIQIDNIKNELMRIFNNTIETIKVDIVTTNFKKETLSKLLHDSGIERNVLPTWIRRFEDDSYRFSVFFTGSNISIKSSAG